MPAAGSARLAPIGQRGAPRVQEQAELTQIPCTRRLDAQMHRTSALLATAVLGMLSTSLPGAMLEGRWGVVLVLLPVLAGAWALLLPWLIAVLHSGPHLSLDERGLRTVLIGDIPWSDVVGLNLRTERSTDDDGLRVRHYLDLCLRHPQRYSVPFWMRQSTPAPHTDYGLYALPLHMFETDPQAVHALALRLRRADPAPFVADWCRDLPLDEVARDLDEGRERAEARAAAHTAPTISGDPVIDYAQRLRLLQDAGEREAESDARRRARAMQREQARRKTAAARQRRDFWIGGTIALAAIAIWYWMKA